MPPQRLSGLDAVRVLGVVAIVAGHVWGTSFVRDLVFPWHVPVFFVLSGFLWRDGRALSEEVSRRGRSLLVPYVCWLALVTAAAEALSVTHQPAKEVVKGGAELLRPYSAFWFVTALFFAAVLLRILDRLRPLAWLVALGGTAVLAPYGDELRQVPLSIGLLGPCLLFMLVGGTVRAVDDRPRVVVGAALAAIAGVAVTVAGLVPPIDLKAADLGSFGGLAISVVVSAGLVLVGRAVVLPPKTGRTVTVLTEAGLVVVLTHALVLAHLETSPAGGWGAFALALIAPWALGVALLWTPLRGLLCGSARPRPQAVTAGAVRPVTPISEG